MVGKMGFGALGFRWLGAFALCLSALACSDDKPASSHDGGSSGHGATGMTLRAAEAGADASSGAHAGHGGTDATSASGAGAGEAGADDAGAAGANGDASISGSIELVAIRGYETPVFLIGFDSDGKGIGFLATKDDAGNPVRIKGVALFDGQETFRMEFDADGKPTVLATGDDAFLFSDYQLGKVHVTHAVRDGDTSDQDINLSDADLAAMTAVPPALGFIEKSVDGSLLGSFAGFGDKVLSFARCATLGSLEVEYDAKVKRRLLKLAAECASEKSLYGKLINLALDSGACATGLGAGAVVVASTTVPPAAPVALAAVGGVAVAGVMHCQDVAEDIADLKAKPSPQPSWFEKQFKTDTTAVHSEITVTVHALPVVKKGEHVSVTAVVEGGKLPYRSAWRINGSLGPENTLSISDAPLGDDALRVRRRGQLRRLATLRGGCGSRRDLRRRPLLFR